MFYVEPEPYWEPAEGKYIVHHAKVVVDAGATGKDWDAMVGAPVEIEPLVRPTGLWTGNLFQGIVRKDGKPVPFAEIEVEYMNDGSDDAAQRRVRHAGHQGRRKRRLHLRHAARGLVGLRRAHSRRTRR